MASSDDEGEALPQTVSNYHFVDDKDEPISFSELPVQWNEDESLVGKENQIFLHGTIDNGLQKIYKQVTAWKFDLSGAKPEVSVLSKDNHWIKLQKPRKSFEDTIRTILITIQCLHFVKKDPEICGRAFWDNLSKVFSLYDVGPSENDLLDHMNLIIEAVKRDESLVKSKFLVTLLEEKPMKGKSFDQNVGPAARSEFIVDDDMIDETEEDGSDEEQDLFDSVCSICDNGGELLCCEGRCMRSFHATVEAGIDSMCESLGFSDEQVDAIQNFYCKNCESKLHQCSSCGELGSSDKLSGAAEVFSCVSATCGRFYHPHCVAKLLHRESEAEAEDLQKKIAAGEPFTCPAHKCFVCEKGENKMDPELQFAICRRCPKSYHRKCLPRKISFEDDEDSGIIQRAWEGLMPNRILIYCLKHVIDDELATPVRNHIIFPGIGRIGQQKNEEASEPPSSRQKVSLKARGPILEDTSRNRIVTKQTKGVEKFSSLKQGNSLKRSEGSLFRPDSSKKQRMTGTSRKTLDKSTSLKVSKSTDENKTTFGDRLYHAYGLMNKGLGQSLTDGEREQTQTVKPVVKELSSLPPLDADAKKRILDLMKDASSSVTLEEITKKHKVPMTHVYSTKNVVDKTITMGKVEGSIEALRTALHKLEEGCSIEDAKAVCEPGLLNQITRWRSKLRVYLAPFLYAMRYTSFGRHFTKVDKLKEIVDKLHWYIQEGDMIVDFCCGANDFSCLMKKKLDEMGKKCAYKNYDILQAKNDFSFEKRDWMGVRTKELPIGSQLIMGLNPPFGVNAALANKFIDKALEFKPKLLILIVPKETERLDKKDTPYDLVWEDDELLVGKSFYLPGSVDVNDKQLEDWNVNPPPLYLWSRPDWTVKHKAISQKHGHLSTAQDKLHLEENHFEAHISDFPADDNNLNCETPVVVDDHRVQDEPEQVQKRASGNGGVEDGKNHGHVKDQSNKTPKSRGKRKRGRGSGKMSPPDNEIGRSVPSRSPPDVSGGKSLDDRASKPKRERGSGEMSPLDNQIGRSLTSRSPPDASGGKSLDDHASKPLETRSHMEIGQEGYQHYERRSMPGSHLQVRTGYGGGRDDDMVREYSFNREEAYPSLAQRWSHGASPASDYEVRNPEEVFTGYRREYTDSRGYGSYLSEIDTNYLRESGLNSQVRPFGRQDPDPLIPRSSYLTAHDPGFSTQYGHLGSTADSTYGRMTGDSSYGRTNMSTMQRYAPRLDELNPARLNNLVSEPSSSLSRSGIYDPLAPRPGFRPDSLGFAPGPHRPFSQHNSSGWLNE